MRYTRDEAQAEMGMAFDSIERAAQLCAADHDLTATRALQRASLNAQRLPQSDIFLHQRNRHEAR